LSSGLYHNPTHLKPDTAYLVARALEAWMPRTEAVRKPMRRVTLPARADEVIR
jgi:hypothetical protein